MATDDTTSKVQENRRRNCRVPLMILQVKVEDGSRVFFGYAKNISRGGLFIATTNPREPGARFVIEFPVPDKTSHKVRCGAEVVWSRDYRPRGTYEPGMGIRFLEIGEEDSQLINEWVERHEEL